MTRNSDSFRSDDRAIEGLPIRLVIALVVGVASLGIMMNMLDGIDEFGPTEVTVEMDDELLTPTGSGYEDVTFSVVTEDGSPVEDAQLLVRGGSVPLRNGPVDLYTGADSNNVTVDVGTDRRSTAWLNFRNTQNRGTLEIEVIPPSEDDFVDDRDNPELVVVDQ